MTTTATTPSYKGFRFPVEIIGHAVWLYHRFTLSCAHGAPDVEELLAARGVIVSYETVQQWSGALRAQFGHQFAHHLRRRRAHHRQTGELRSGYAGGSLECGTSPEPISE